MNNYYHHHSIDKVFFKEFWNRIELELDTFRNVIQESRNLNINY